MAAAVALAAPARVNPHWADRGVEPYIPPISTTAAHLGAAVQSNRFIRRCPACMSSNLAWAADKRYSLSVKTASTSAYGRHFESQACMKALATVAPCD